MDAQENKKRETLQLRISGEGNKNYSIVAGAGGGKTTLLSDRISRQIKNGTPIDAFVVITYTNAAANELRDKIADKLNTMLQQRPSDDVVREALANIELMQISTIHSFLLKILREYAFESHVVLGAGLVEDEDDENRKQSFLAQWQKAHFKEMRNLFRDDWVTNNGYHYSQSVLKSTFSSLADIREEIVIDENPTYGDIFNTAATCVETLLAPMQNLAYWIERTHAECRPTNKSGSEKKLLKQTTDFINCMDGLADADLSAGRKVIAAAIQMVSWLTLIAERHAGEAAYYRNGDPSPMYDEVVDAETEVLSNVDTDALYMNLEEVYNAYKARKVVRYLQKVQQAYQQAYGENTLELNNNDILFRAEQFLLQHPEVLDRLRKRYAKIYVDEFQDTTGLQTRIVKMLSEEPGTAPEDEILTDDKLIVVGDPKQSIYRFTGAELSVYEDVNRMMVEKDNCEVIRLDYNFRSNKAIIDWVNRTYDGWIQDYTWMTTEWHTKNSKALAGVYRFDGAGLKNTKDDPGDARETVRLISSLVESSKCFLEERNGKLRRIRWNDFMVITRDTTNMSLYANEFYAQGIPVSIAGKIRVDNDEVLSSFVQLITWFAHHRNLQQKLSAVQVYAGQDVSKDNHDALQESEAGLMALYHWFEEEHFSMPAMVQYLLNHEKYYVPKNRKYSREEVRTYRIHLHQMVENCLESDVHDLEELAEQMEIYRTGQVKKDVSLVHNENAVRLMNVHQSKGLTANIVIIADRTKEESPRYDGFRKAGKYYPAVTYRMMENSGVNIIPTFKDNEEIYTMAEQEETEEFVRLQYVAATRAAHALIIMPAWKEGTWFTDEHYHYDSLQDIRWWLQWRQEDDVTARKKRIKENETLTLEDLKKHLENRDPDMDRTEMIRISPSQLEGDGLSGYTPTDAGYVREDRPSGKGLGLVMHKAFELLVQRYSALDQTDKEAAVEQILNEAVMCEKDEMLESDDPVRIITFLRPVLVKYLDTVIAPIIERAAEIYPEYTFSFYVEQNELPAFLDAFRADFRRCDIDLDRTLKQVWVNGTADLVVKQKDGTIKIYDYKSDARNGMPAEEFSTSLMKKYTGQLRLYHYAISRSFGTDKISTELIHLYR